MNGEINTTINTLPPFKYFINSIGELPSSYLESMSYYETLLWLCNYLKETIIPTVNNTGNAVTELQNLYLQLQNYVNNYFDNLDVQEEINNKLDAMARDGSLTLLIKNYVDPLIDEVNEDLDEHKSYVQNELNLQNTKIRAIESGSPLVASSTTGMTNTSRVYVNTSDGNWYYYNGTNWVIGGIYQASEDSDSVDLLNSLGEKLFIPLFDETFEGGEEIVSNTIIRTFRPFNFKLNTIYRIEITVNDYHSNAYDEAFNLRTSLKVTTTETIKDPIFSFLKNDIPINPVILYFTPENIASWLYFYFNVNGTYNINIKIKQLISDYKINTTNDLNILNEILEKGYNKTANYKETSSPDFKGGIKRFYLPYTFIKDRNYLINIKFNYYCSRNISIYYSLKTTLENNNTNVIDEIDEYSETSENHFISTLTGENLLYEYTPSNNCYYLYVYINTHPIFKDYDFELDIYEKPLSEISQLPYLYNGERINLEDSSYNCELLTHITTPNNKSVQGMSIYNDIIYQLQDTGILNIYDIEGDGTPLAYTNLASYDVNNHANCCNFGNVFYNDNSIPLLYVTTGKVGDISLKCFVENINVTKTGDDYSVSTSLVQTITFDQTNFENKGYKKIWDCPAYLVSPDNKYLYVFGAKYRTNGSQSQYDLDNMYIITKFKYPDISNSEVTLTADDVIEQFTTEYQVDFTQGGTLHNDLIIYSFGLGTTAHPSKIGIWNVNSKSLINTIDLTDAPCGNQELEDVYVYENHLYITTQSKNIYKLTF